MAQRKTRRVGFLCCNVSQIRICERIERLAQQVGTRMYRLREDGSHEPLRPVTKAALTPNGRVSPTVGICVNSTALQRGERPLLPLGGRETNARQR